MTGNFDGPNFMELGQYTKNRKQIPYTVDRQNLVFIGKGQSGKTQTLLRMAMDDIHQGQSICIIGSELTDEVLKLIPKDRQEETVYFNPTLQPFSFNPFRHVPEEKHEALTDAFVDAILSKSSYGEGDTPRLEHMLRGCILTLLRNKYESPLSIYYLLTRDSFRKRLTQHLGDPHLQHFWDHFKGLPKNNQLTRIESTENKLGSLVFSRPIRDCLDQCGNHVLNNGITLLSLDSLVLGVDRASSLGAMVIASLIGQADDPVTFYIDDAEQYGSRILGRLLRHPKFTSVLAVRSLDKLHNFNELTKSSLLIALTTSILDARILETQFNLNNNHYPLNLIPRYEAYVMGTDEFADIFKLKLHDYKPAERSKRSKKTMEQRIIDRCWRQCTMQQAKIEKRLGRFFDE